MDHFYSIICCNLLNFVEATEPSNVLSIRTNVVCSMFDAALLTATMFQTHIYIANFASAHYNASL